MQDKILRIVDLEYIPSFQLVKRVKSFEIFKKVSVKRCRCKCDRLSGAKHVTCNTIDSKTSC